MNTLRASPFFAQGVVRVMTNGIMGTDIPYDQVLERFCSAVADTYGDRLERVVLFGSRARGDARPDSDYDIAVFVRQLESFWDEVRRLAGVTTDILTETGAVISAKPFRAGSYDDPLPLMSEIRRDGLDL